MRIWKNDKIDCRFFRENDVRDYDEDLFVYAE